MTKSTTKRWTRLIAIMSIATLLSGVSAYNAPRIEAAPAATNTNASSYWDGFELYPNDGYDNGSNNTTTTNTVAAKMINLGDNYLGVKYKFGASTETTKVFDCSSFMHFLYMKQGIDLPRASYEQATVGKKVQRSELKKGDLLFFATGRRGKGKIAHVAMYAGNGKILHTFGKPGVTYSDLKDWDNTYVTARRILNDDIIARAKSSMQRSDTPIKAS
ncbi:C40 family peptidase [Paenibacillus sp. MER TA 81-3]|uniref:C40 family peptidase n=1 Tax=Paenibacillus sp. MER TA 81-3 TaxID=2939573 RepID=UPI00203C571E|nr:C40 family peptidase [Paenibacillus sp. MER TA 81-3]MCM3339905.1 C40 family peptidase [Paenibacillus sp. MER TA 81-3]